MHLQRYCQLIKNWFCIKPQEFNLGDMIAQIRQCFGTVQWGGLFSFWVAVSARKVIIPLFYHLAVLDYKPCYSQGLVKISYPYQ